MYLNTALIKAERNKMAEAVHALLVVEEHVEDYVVAFHPFLIYFFRWSVDLEDIVLTTAETNCRIALSSVSIRI
jgi:hypothetical protein